MIVGLIVAIAALGLWILFAVVFLCGYHNGRILDMSKMTNNPLGGRLMKSFLAELAASNWQMATPIVSAPASVKGVCYSPLLGLYVAVGDADGVDALILTSQDGMTWTEQANPQALNLKAVCWNEDLQLFCAVGDPDAIDAYILLSNDGSTWLEQANPQPIALNCVSANGFGFVAGGEPDAVAGDAYLVSSMDGLLWIRRANTVRGIPSYLYAATFGANSTLWKFVLVGEDDNSDPICITSDDAIIWVDRALPATLHRALRGVSFNGSLFCAVGKNTIITSPNGETWTVRPLPANRPAADLKAIAWNGIDRSGVDGTLFVAVGDRFNNVNNPAIFTSPDGLVWSAHDVDALGLDLPCVACGGSRRELFVAGAANDGGTATMTRSLRGA